MFSPLLKKHQRERGGPEGGGGAVIKGAFGCLDIHRWDRSVHGYATFGWVDHWDEQNHGSAGLPYGQFSMSGTQDPHLASMSGK